MAKKLQVITDIEKRFGAGSAMLLTRRPPKVAVVPTGALTLDTALGVGGWPFGRIVEVWGPESSGKTTLALHAVASYHATGKSCVAAFVDAEHALDAAYAGALGVDLKRLIISQPDCGEDALETVDMLVTGGVKVIVVDSVAALTPRAEIEGEMGDSHMGLHARLMSQALRKLAAPVSKYGALLIFINQSRTSFGGGFSFETCTGGNALKFYASIRVRMAKDGSAKTSRIAGPDGDRGVRTVAVVRKNKLAPPFREAKFDIVFGSGIDANGCVLEVARDAGVVDVKGSWYWFGENRFANGRVRAVEALVTDPELRQRIVTAIDTGVVEDL